MRAGCARSTRTPVSTSPSEGCGRSPTAWAGTSLGDLASRMAVEALGDVQPPQSLEEFVVATEARLQTVNRRLRARGGGAQRELGSAAPSRSCWRRERYCAYLWAGDSRIYLCRHGRLSAAHPRSQRAGRSCGPRGAPCRRRRPSRCTFDGSHVRVGAEDELELDGDVVEVEDGDVFLLCSDGLSNEVSEAAIERRTAAREIAGRRRESCSMLALKARRTRQHLGRRGPRRGPGQRRPDRCSIRRCEPRPGRSGHLLAARRVLVAEVLRPDAVLLQQRLQMRAVHVAAPRQFGHRAADLVRGRARGTRAPPRRSRRAWHRRATPGPTAWPRRLPRPSPQSRAGGAGRMSAGRCSRSAVSPGQARDPVDDVAQLADVARVARSSAGTRASGGVSFDRPPLQRFRRLVAEVFEQQRDLVLALAQRRQRHVDDAEPVEQVFAELAFLA